MQQKRIIDLLETKPSPIEIIIKGWVRAFRSNRFIALNDGSTIKNLQCVVDFENFEESLLKKITVGAAVQVFGTIVESQGQGQKVEIQVSKVEILGEADPEEVKQEYGIHLIDEISEKYEGILLAVSHTKFSMINIESIKKDSKSVIYDLKGFLPRNQVNSRL